jgi:hypothetical protein
MRAPEDVGARAIAQSEEQRLAQHQGVRRARDNILAPQWANVKRLGGFPDEPGRIAVGNASSTRCRISGVEMKMMRLRTKL